MKFVVACVAIIIATMLLASSIVKSVDPLAQQIYVIDRLTSNINKDKAIEEIIKKYYLNNGRIK